MKITEKIVQSSAALARLSMSDEELKKYSGQLEQILEFIDKLNTLDVSGVEPTAAILDIKNVVREDIIKQDEHREAILDNAPAKEETFFVVPQVIKG